MFVAKAGSPFHEPNRNKTVQSLPKQTLICLQGVPKQTLILILFFSRAIGSRQGSPSHEPDLNKNGTGGPGKMEEIHNPSQVTNHQQAHHQHHPPIR